MKKIKYIVFLIVFLLFPINALAYDQGTKNCYYEGKVDDRNYQFHLTLYNLGTGTSPVASISAFYKKNNQQSDTYKKDLDDNNLVNYSKDQGIKFSLYNFYVDISERVQNGEKKLLSNDNKEACPSNIYYYINNKKGFFEKKTTEKKFVICNGVNKTLNVDTCKLALDYIKKQKNATNIVKTSFTSSTGYSNVNKSDKTKTDINKAYNDLKEQRKDVCDENSSNYDKAKCEKLSDQLNDLKDQSGDLAGDQIHDPLDYQNEINKNLSFCTGNTLRAFQALGYMIFIAKVIIPLLLIIMGSIDLAKAVLNSNEKPNKEVLTKFAKRLGAALIVFLIPSVLDFAIGLVDGAKDAMENENTKVSSCTKCLFDPLGSECKAPENLTNE
ncbi:hypothetical protein EGR52_05395 [bacterium]|nr:hypothetical protein [bacterium]